MAEVVDALLGHTGFVGSTLLRQRAFGACYNSGNIAALAGRHHGLVVCAAAPAQKWLANREPTHDLENLRRLMAALAQLHCERFVLISTVDVYGLPQGVDESVQPDTAGLHPYGLHRLELERFVASRFAQATIVRLPGLVGPGLRKNALHDLHHRHDVHKLDSRGRFQFYPMVNLWSDLQRVLALGLPLAHFGTEPLSLAEIAREAFGLDRFDQVPDPSQSAASYDLRSRHAEALGGAGGYLYNRREVLGAIRAYTQSEPGRAE